MKDNVFRKGMVYAIVILFIGISIIPLTGSNVVVENVNNENRTLMIEYYTLNVYVDGCGWVEPFPIPPYPPGTIIELTAIPCPGWMFDHWSGDIHSYDNPICITMDSDMSITAHFWYTLPIEIVGCGYVIKEPGQSSYPVGDNVQLTAVPDDGWEFDGWSGDIIGSDNPIILVVRDDMTEGVTATFVENNTIVSIQPSTITVKPGEAFTVSVYVEPGEPIIGVSIQCLYFNASLLHADLVWWGDLWPGPPIFFMPGDIDNVAGTITDMYSLVLPANAVNNSGSAFVIYFTAQQTNGTSVLDLDGVSIKNENGVTVPNVVYDGSVTVVLPPEINNVMLTASDPLDTEPGFGWENFSCIVTDNEAVNQVKLVVTYPDTTTVEYLMTNIPGTDTYYYSTTFTQSCPCCWGYCRNYTYYIRADDAMGNNATSSPEQFFLPSNWDVDMNGRVYFDDLIAIVLMYGATGPGYPSPSSFGWVREDVNNDGRIYFDGLIAVVMHYGE